MINSACRSLALVAVVALASIVSSAESASVSDETTVYVVYREAPAGPDLPAGTWSGPGCNDAAAADSTVAESRAADARPIVGIRGFVLDEEYSLTGGEADDSNVGGGSCADEMACFVSPESEACLSLQRTFDAYGEIIAQSRQDALDEEEGGDGSSSPSSLVDYYNCVRRSPSLSQCYKVGCGVSSLYPHCEFSIMSPSKLADALYPPSSSSSTGSTANDNIVYAAHYADGECTADAFVGLRGFLVDGTTGTQLPVLGSAENGDNDNDTDDDVGCAAAMACLLQPDSVACEMMGPTDVVEVTIGRVVVDEEADGASTTYELCAFGDNGGDGQCQDISAESSCVQSPIYPSCYVRLI